MRFTIGNEKKILQDQSNRKEQANLKKNTAKKETYNSINTSTKHLS